MVPERHAHDSAEVVLKLVAPYIVSTGAAVVILVGNRTGIAVAISVGE